MRDPEKYKEWYEKNKEKLKQQSHERYLKRDKNKMKEYRKANPEKVKKWAKKFIEKNPEKTKGYCKKWHEKNPNYRSEYYEKNKQKLLEQTQARKDQNELFIKSFLIKCQECQTEDKSKLCFHHIDKANKNFTISNNKGASLKKLKEEIDKCIVLCKSCHAKLHDKETPMEKKIAKGKANIGRKNTPETIEKMKKAWLKRKLEGKSLGGHHRTKGENK